MSNILITGGAGYVGSVLAPYLASKNHFVTTYDLMMYGNTLPKNPNIKITGNIKSRVRKNEEKSPPSRNAQKTH